MMTRKTLVYVSVLCVSVGLAFLLFPFAMRGVYRCLVTEIPTTHADVIVVLSGGTGERVREGVRLYESGMAKKLLMTGGPFFEVSMADVMTNYAVSLGVPSRNIVQESRSVSTYTNATGSFPILHRMGARRVILVTSRFHTARAYHIFKQVFPPEIELFVYAAPDGVDEREWWQHGEMAETVLIELGKTFYYRFRY
jgi:uncharacterized SAM-binding protein YcdF (DUF218 family)